ncbi:hypothetical protein GUJ93_ZPchr0004g40053 [Zizania palustris]|uniref:TF-B3 domain-containing protein n=2 Tax=Zizania palustris TaxID=103762 RepID=A0A8J5VYT7_ZIZPA|nr:hypothetical protein GUJ93_ZPchr0004g40053 [Zizania palustris]
MGSLGVGDCHGVGAAKAMRQLKVMLPSSFRKMRISDELAALLGAGGRNGGGAATARVVSPFGKVWHVEVGRDGDGDGGAFLGLGWSEFAAAHGVDVGWFLMLRHHGGGVLTVKVFDATCCLKEFGAPPSDVTTRSNGARGASHKPQFVRVLLPGSMEKMMIPNKFVQHYITDALLNSQMANILSPVGKFWRIGVEKDQSGVFFTGGWLQFLSFHGIGEGDVLLLRYEGNMVFKINVFGLNGCQKDCKTKDIRIRQYTGNQQEAHPLSGRKCNNNKDRVCDEDSEYQLEKTLSSMKRSSSRMMTSGQGTKRQAISKSIYEIGPDSWIKKEINNTILKRRTISLAPKFCRTIGLLEEGPITLETSTGGSRRSWEVVSRLYPKGFYLLGLTWNRFCQDNNLKPGDVCVFNVVETRLWHVVINRC